MSKRFEELARRKQALIEKAAAERFQIASAYKRISAPLDVSGLLFRIGRTLRTHPLMTAGISSFVISGLSKKLLRVGRMVLGLRRVILPVWSWWFKRRRRGR